MCQNKTIMKIELKPLLNRLYEKALFEEDVLSTAAQVAFYFSFALFPMMLFLISLVGIILGSADDLRGEFFFYLRQIMPYSAYELVQTTIEEVTQSSSGGKLTLGLLIALWSASAGVDSLRVALNSVYNLEEQRPWIKTKLLSIILTLTLTTLVIIATGIVFYGWKFLSLILDTVNLPIPSPFILMMIQIFMVLTLLLIIFALIYNFLPNNKPFKWVWITPGAVTGIILWLSLSYLFRLYLSYFNTYDKTYGSLGAVIILLLWLLLTAMVILIGGIINSTFQEMTDPEAAAEAEEKSAIKLEKAKADMPSDKVDEMIKEKNAEKDKAGETYKDNVITVNLPQSAELQPANFETKTLSEVKSERQNIKTPNKTLVGLTVAGVFGFLMGAMFNKKDR